MKTISASFVWMKCELIRSFKIIFFSCTFDRSFLRNYFLFVFFLESNEILDKYLGVNLIEKAVLIKIDVKKLCLAQ